MSVLVERTANAPANLTIGKEGAGRLYFRIGTQYAPANLKLAAADYGFPALQPQPRRWTNTQENVFILLGLDRYFATYERVIPDFVARVWLGTGYDAIFSFSDLIESRDNSSHCKRLLLFAVIFFC